MTTYGTISSVLALFRLISAMLCEQEAQQPEILHNDIDEILGKREAVLDKAEISSRCTVIFFYCKPA
jgi:hypothetical protein